MRPMKEDRFVLSTTIIARTRTLQKHTQNVEENTERVHINVLFIEGHLSDTLSRLVQILAKHASDGAKGRHHEAVDYGEKDCKGCE